MARKLISIFGICSGLLFFIIGANEADYMAEIGQAGYRWLQYLISGAVLFGIGVLTKRGE